MAYAVLRCRACSSFRCLIRRVSSAMGSSCSQRSGVLSSLSSLSSFRGLGPRFGSWSSTRFGSSGGSFRGLPGPRFGFGSGTRFDSSGSSSSSGWVFRGLPGPRFGFGSGFGSSGCSSFRGLPGPRFGFGSSGCSSSSSSSGNASSGSGVESGSIHLLYISTSLRESGRRPPGQCRPFAPTRASFSPA